MFQFWFLPLIFVFLTIGNEIMSVYSKNWGAPYFNIVCGNKMTTILIFIRAIVDLFLLYIRSKLTA